MTQAFAGIVDRVALVTSGDVLSFGRQTALNLGEWYRVTKRFELVRLPIRWRSAYPLDRGYNPRLFPHMGGLYAAWRRPDLVVSRVLASVSIAVRCGVPALYETHSAEVDGATLRKLMRTGRLVAVVTISDYLKEVYCNREGLPEDRVWVLPDGVDLGGYRTGETQGELRRELGLPVSATIAAYVGHLYENRGLEEIFSCAANLPDIHFAIVGGYPDDVDRRRGEIERQGLRNVEFTGFVSNALVPKYLRAADILLMPYSQHVDTVKWMSPLKLFEYMGASRPIVASRLPALQAILTDGDNALLVEPDSAEALKGAIGKLTADTELAGRLGKKALADVHAYTWDRRVHTIIDRCRALRG